MKQNNFKFFQIQNAKDLISNAYNNEEIKIKNEKTIEVGDDKRFKLRRLNKKNKELYVFSKKAFNTFTDDHDVVVVGKIRKRQCRYKDYDDSDELIKEKKKKNIIGQARLDIEHKDNEEPYKKYDIKKNNGYFTYGYAWVGSNKFIRVTRFNPFLIIIPLLLIICILLGLMFIPEEPIIKLPFANGTSMPESVSENIENDSYVTFVPYQESITLTEDQKWIPFINPTENKGKWYLSFSLYVNGEPFVDKSTGEAYSTGLISPDSEENNVVLYNLYDQLDAGTYYVQAVADAYDYETKDKTVKPPGYLTTTITIVK